MSFKLLTNSQQDRLARVMAWAELQMNGLGEDQASLNQRNLNPIRGFLLQNIYGGGAGVMRLAYRTQQLNATQVDIVGVNFVANSKFKLKIIGTPKSGANPTSGILCTTAPIKVDSTASDIASALLLAAQGQNLAVTRNDFQVALGNPASEPDLIQLENEQAELDFTVSPPETYTGSWIISITGTLTKLYKELKIEPLEDTNAFMLGQSIITSRPIIDVPGTTNKVVFDLFNRPKEYPWKVGTLCVAIPFMDLGYGIIGSDFRDQTISIPTAEPN